MNRWWWRKTPNPLAIEWKQNNKPEKVNCINKFRGLSYIKKKIILK